MSGTPALTGQTPNIEKSRTAIRCDAAIDGNNPVTFYCDLDGDGTGNEADDGEWVVCLFLTWFDACSYLDWAGLRPMTELEYEKACRGNQTPVAGEFAWGSTSYTLLTGVTSSGSSSEVPTPTNSNLSIAALDPSNTNVPVLYNPIRVGAFATSSSTRV